MIERCEKVIPEEKVTYWKTSDDKEFNTEEGAIAHQKCINSKAAFKEVRKDFTKFWPYAQAARGEGWQTIFVSNDVMREWLVQNENMVIFNLYQKIGDFNNETNK